MRQSFIRKKSRPCRNGRSGKRPSVACARKSASSRAPWSGCVVSRRVRAKAHRLRPIRALELGRRKSSQRATMSLIRQQTLGRKSSRPVRALHRSLAILWLRAVHRSSQRRSSRILSLRHRLRCQRSAFRRHKRFGLTSVMVTLDRQPRSRTSTKRNQ